MATTGAPVARLITGAGAMAVAGWIAAVCVGTDGLFTDAVTSLAVFGVVVTVVALALGWSTLSIVAALSLGASFALTRYDEPATLDLRAVPIAVGLLVLCELVAWSTESRTSVAPGVPVLTRTATFAIVVSVAGGLTAVVAAVATLPLRDAVGLVSLGVAAVALVALVLLRLLRAATV